jgi:hypothetical protein
MTTSEFQIGDNLLGGTYQVTSVDAYCTVATKVLKSGRLGKGRIIRFHGGQWKNWK